ncbi:MULTISPECIES: TrbC/VirB2 family protein [Vagococcus]|uniref:Uncharacterized protein n=1 Tax=Vagococcus fluvialis bH819 TaxID=1255619 RepID=A0A1X6WS20_9ENTE|nr:MULTISPECIES: TrbC/VirB2 family protein [Vagococcus]SLM87084.1 hypothetical protein FM121_13380 [Vagococcus fluvialis bH819]HCM90567.1 hypothetical protein [Vagococcus sp.]
MFTNVLSKLGVLQRMDFFDNVNKFMSNMTGKLQGVSLSVIIFCVSVTGLMFLFGEGPSRTAKKWLTYIVIGACIVFGASTIGNTIKSVGGF